MVISRIDKSTKVSCPYNQGEILPSMEGDRVDRVHSVVYLPSLCTSTALSSQW
jgi:hypothetical protein